MYGKTLSELASQFGVSTSTVFKWHKAGQMPIKMVKNTLPTLPTQLLQCLMNARGRCNNPKTHQYKYYGGRGIKCELTHEDVIRIWKRDKAYLMECPTIDRINSDKNYTLNNCRFLEFWENRSLGNKKK